MADAAAAPPKKSRKKGMMIGALALLLVAGGSAAATVLLVPGVMGGGDHAPEPEQPKLVPREGADEARVAAALANPRTAPDPALFVETYVPLEEPFTSNLLGGANFIQVALAFSTFYDERVPANIEKHKLAIRSAVLVVLSEQDPLALTTTSGKDALRAKLAAAANAVLRSREGFGGVHEVHFTSLVTQ